MSFSELPERLNAAAVLIDAHLDQGRAEKPAILSGDRVFILPATPRGGGTVSGNALRELDVRLEERVAFLLPDSPEWVIVFFGAMKIGAVSIPMNTLPGFERLRISAQRQPGTRASSACVAMAAHRRNP